MNKVCLEFVQFVATEAPKHNKAAVEAAVVSRFGLVKDRKVYYNQCFAVRFSYSKSTSPSFSNTVLSLSALEKYDRIPFFVVLVRQLADNLVLLANSTFLKKVSHSSKELGMNNIVGSFNGSDIMREYNGLANRPVNFSELFAVHQGLDWQDNLERLVEATAGIKPVGQKFVPDEEQLRNILQSVERALNFVNSPDFDSLYSDLNDRCTKCSDAILVASHIENTNIRGRLIESLITADAAKRKALQAGMKDIEPALPPYDTRNDLGDYHRRFADADTYTDIKTKVVCLQSNPKAYNIDKFLKQMAEPRSVFLFFFVGVNECGVFRTILSPVYQNVLIDSTILQHHWAGRSSRGVAQFKGATIDEMINCKDFYHCIDREKAQRFLEELLKR